MLRSIKKPPVPLTRQTTQRLSCASQSVTAMRQQREQFRIEWGFVALWLSCARPSPRFNIAGPAPSAARKQNACVLALPNRPKICYLFDATLVEYCSASRPESENLGDQNREAVHTELFQKWKATNPRPVLQPPRRRRPVRKRNETVATTTGRKTLADCVASRVVFAPAKSLQPWPPRLSFGQRFQRHDLRISRFRRVFR